MSVIDWLSQKTFGLCGAKSLVDPTVTLTTLDWMEQSALGTCVSSSGGVYYVGLGFHSLGLAMLVGALMVIDLRILNVLRGIPAEGLTKIESIGWWGFWINAVSGLIIFFSEANKMFYDTTFRWKLLLIFLGVASTMVMSRSILTPATMGASSVLESGMAKAQALVSLLIWLAVIIVGRMIAYLAEG